MSATVLVGLTGGIASGKSTIAAMLTALGAVVVDADALAREALAPGSPGLVAVVAQFGPQVLTDDGVLDRAGLARRVFGDDAARAALEAIVHPEVARGFEAAVVAAGPGAVVVHDVPLLVENDLAGRYDLVVVAHAPLEVRIARAQARGMTREAVLARVAAQADDAARLAAADVVVDTGAGLAETREAVERLWATRILPLVEDPGRR